MVRTISVLSGYFALGESKMASTAKSYAWVLHGGMHPVVAMTWEAREEIRGC